MSDEAVALKIEQSIEGFQLAPGEGCNLFRGEVSPAVRNGQPTDTPARAIFVLLTGGASPRQYHGRSERQRVNFDNVQVRIRGDVDGFRQGQEDGKAALAAVHDSAPPAPGVTGDPMAGFIDCQVLESKPSYLGTDDGGHPEWSFNAELKREETGP